MAAWRLTRSSFLNSAISAAIRFVWRAGTLRPILTVTHEPLSGLAVGRDISSRCLPWRQSGDGLAICRRTWNAEEERGCGVAIARADGGGTFPGYRVGGGHRRGCWRGVALAIRQDCRRLRSFCLWTPALNSQEPSPLGRNANRVSRSVHLVLPDGFRSWRRLHAFAVLAKNINAAHCSRHGHSFAPSSRRRFRRTMDGAHRRACTYAGISSGNRIDRVLGLREGWS